MSMIEVVSNLIVDCFKRGNKVLTFGVGGNAATAIHFAAELAGKFESYEEPLPCIDLCSNPSVLTAITNDFGWEYVFERQIRALAKPGDTVVTFNISSRGIYHTKALLTTVGLGCTFISICGKKASLATSPFLVEWELGSSSTPWVQEEQLRIVHQVCGKVKSSLQLGSKVCKRKLN